MFRSSPDKPHSALDGKTPVEVFKQDDKKIRWASQEQLDYAFVFTEQRLVDKTGCLSFRSTLWEAGQDLIGMKVDVSFRPGTPDEIEIFHEGFEPRKIKPLIMTEHSAPRKRLLVPKQIKPVTSRELDAAAKQYEKNRDLARTAISCVLSRGYPPWGVRTFSWTVYGASPKLKRYWRIDDDV